ncbi:MAG TPA: prefoldin subunit beta [Nanoarchaeota archaeon]|nr:MAG: prefoldin beta subunit [archaeon GW2011_AR6]MBS3082596.1 prefoldin subunit beta [Candidatus Pacearchaeota archaeon]HIH17443.1 prefoldin subunit beta [Nanoarchaeota archaeon]HIH33974.1 prefoldin subunit beta [Nanoarchaeota archaeon]HIH66693.1 prefoldin subunit beta [Nanoarchaeota archaeon]
MEQDIDEKVKELQLLEQNLGNLLFQKQTFQLELGEVTSASEELEASKGDVFKIVGNVMIKSSKERLKKELDEKKDLISLRMKSIEKQERALQSHVEELRKTVLKHMK